MHIKSRIVSKDKESHYITIKGSVPREDITIINIYTLKSRAYIPNINISEKRNWRIVKLSILLTAVNGFKAIRTKIPMAFCYRRRKNYLEIHMEPPKAWIAKAILGENNAGGTTLPDFKIHYKAIVMKTVWHWHEDRHTDQWNSTESPEIHPYNWSSTRVPRTHNEGKDSLFNRWCWETWISICRRTKLDSYSCNTQKSTQSGLKT